MHPLFHLAVVWAAVFVAVVAAKKTRLTPVLYFLLAGAVLVNAGILPEESGEFMREFAELGIILIMFALGFEETTDNFFNSMKKSWGIALFGALGPFLVSYAIADYIWQDSSLSLMCALAMTATAVSLTMVSLRSEGLQDSPVATRIMTSAVIDDIGALAAVAIVVPLAVGEGDISVSSVLLTAGKAISFFLIVSVIGAWIFPRRTEGSLHKLPLLGRFGLNKLLTFDDGRFATLAVLLAALCLGLIASYFGFHPAVGAYMAGLVIKEEYFRQPRNRRDNEVEPDPDVYAETKRTVDSVAFSWIGPVFFVDLGTRLIFDAKLFIEILPYAVVLTIGIFVVQVVTAGLAAKWTGGMSSHESLMIGFGMLGRAELAFVVMDIAYVQHEIMHKEAFFTLMITAFFLNIAVPMTIRWWKPYYIRAGSDVSEEPAS